MIPYRQILLYFSTSVGQFSQSHDSQSSFFFHFCPSDLLTPIYLHFPLKHLAVANRNMNKYLFLLQECTPDIINEVNFFEELIDIYTDLAAKLQKI